LADSALRLYPLPVRETSPERIYEDLELPPAGYGDLSRPYVIINMVTSLDGRTTVQGKAARIGGEIDRQVMRNLRAKADAVMIGANTLRAERLSLGLDEADAGSQPLGVILTNTGDVPLERNLIKSETQKVLVLVSENVPPASVSRLRRHAEVLRARARPDGSVDIEDALKILKTEHGVTVVLTEGGPTLNHALVSGKLADELFLTLASRLLGGVSHEARGIVAGPALSGEGAKLAEAYLAGDELFLRYAISQP
jgi:2,5-diamino-6-(ribosylamino)-4(3H)-pyrimidinone 5'-phosphate reductase